MILVVINENFRKPLNATRDLKKSDERNYPRKFENKDF